MAPLRIYAVLGLEEPPVELSQRPGQESFYGHFSLPPPEHIVIFCVGDPAPTAEVALHLGTDFPTRTLGQLTPDARSLCTTPKFTPAERKKINSLVKTGGHLAKVVVTRTEESASKSTSSVNVSPPMAVKGEHLETTEASKKRGGSPTEVKGGGRKRRKSSSIPSVPSDDLKVGKTPSPRWGHTIIPVGENQVLLVGGQGGDTLSRDSVWKLDTRSLAWTSLDADAATPPTRMGHSAGVDTESGMAYIFGGAKYKRFFNDVHQFDCTTASWALIAPESGSAPNCSYHSCSVYRGELFVFGGVYPKPDPIPDVCSNALQIFNLKRKNWYSPNLTGKLPDARSGHSGTLVGDDLVIFGGWDQPTVFNDVHILELMMMETSELETRGDRPSPRCWHVAILLPIVGSRKILVHGGFDGDGPLGSAHVLDLDTATWHDVSAVFKCTPRAGHAACMNAANDSLLIWGGGDNGGEFFDDTCVVPLADIIALL